MSYCKTCGKQLPPDTPAGIDQCMACSGSAFCAECGKPVPRDEQIAVRGSIYCRSCAQKAATPVTTPTPSAVPQTAPQPVASTVPIQPVQTTVLADGDYLNAHYQDNIQNYLRSIAPTAGNLKKEHRNNRLLGIFSAVMTIVLLVVSIALVMPIGLIPVMMGLMISFACFSADKKAKKQTPISSEEAFIAEWRHPQFGTAEEVQAIINEVRRTLIYRDDVIAFNQHYLIQCKYAIPKIIRLSDIIAVTSSFDETNFELDIFDLQKHHKFIYLESDYKALVKRGLSTTMLVDSLRPYCPNAFCMPNKRTSSIPKEVTKHVNAVRAQAQANVNQPPRQ